MTAESGWFAARPSGTEDIYKIYVESFRGENHLRRVLEEAEVIVGEALGAAPKRNEGRFPASKKRRYRYCNGEEGNRSHLGVLLTPTLGAVLMSASTVIVAINARLLKLKK